MIESLVAGPSTPTVAGRLIHTPAARRQLLAAIAAVPAGAKLSIPALRDALVNQADVLDALQALVAAGEIERTTLRPPPPEHLRTIKPCAEARPKTGRRFSDEPSKPLMTALIAEAARRGLSQQRTSIAVFGVKSRLAMIAKVATVRRATADRIRAWIADKPLSAVEAPPEREPEATFPPPSAPEPIPPAAPTGANLAADLDALIAEHGLSKTKVSVRLFGMKGGIESLRRRQRIKPVTIDKVRALLADPPLDELRLKVVGALSVRRTRAPQSRRDPTQKPETPLMDVADRQRLNGQRYQANIRRGQEREATARLDAGKPARNSFERTTMAAIERRREVEHRQTDPVEQAKLALKRKGRVVHSAMIHGGRKDRFMVGGQRDARTGRLKELTPAELIDLAEKVTGQTFRRSAA